MPFVSVLLASIFLFVAGLSAIGLAVFDIVSGHGLDPLTQSLLISAISVACAVVGVRVGVAIPTPTNTEPTPKSLSQIDTMQVPAVKRGPGL